MAEMTKSLHLDNQFTPNALSGEHRDICVVAVGASEGGLSAFRILTSMIEAGSGLAYILVPLRDPAIDGPVTDLLSAFTDVEVTEAVDGERITADRIYVAPPGAEVTIAADHFHVEYARLGKTGRPAFDLLLISLADAYGPRAASVTLSGEGEDGALGVAHLKARGGWVIAQSPEEAEHGVMPLSTIATGCADLILPVAEIPDTISRRAARALNAPVNDEHLDRERAFQEIIALVRATTELNFQLYKPGTLRRRIERRAALCGLGANDIRGYLVQLNRDEQELHQLTADLLINVTSFFRDPEIFEALAATTLPDVIRRHEGEDPIRVWVAGCSTGQEAYTIAMLFLEAMQDAKARMGLQIFASDLDTEALAHARRGVYPKSIETELTPSRLRRFFKSQPGGYRVRPELRNTIVFSTQNILEDPPFSRLDFVACRNVLIYFSAEAQAKAFSLFHFALEPDGILLLGAAEAPGPNNPLFTPASKTQRTYRRAADVALTFASRPLFNTTPDSGEPQSTSDSASNRPASRIAAACQAAVLEHYAPPSILINHAMACVYLVGNLDRFIRVPAGAPTRLIMDMALPAIAPTLRSAVHLARHENRRVSFPLRVDQGMTDVVDVCPVDIDGERFHLVSFIAPREDLRASNLSASAGTDALQNELAATKTQLDVAIRDLDLAAVDQRAASDEALSIQEQYQSTNEELLTSKEELQSLNEELSALNTQLSETIERQRLTSSDLQNVIYSTHVAAIFLDKDLRIRFYTPSAVKFFNLIPSDIGRPLTDLKSATEDQSLLQDARQVLETSKTEEREIRGPNDEWYSRHIFPYVALDQNSTGVVIKFANITHQKLSAAAVNEARSEAERANQAKSRFLAAASHDLRQPLQTLSLLQGLLSKTVTGDGAQRLIRRFDETLMAMAGMLNTLLDINQIEAGDVHPDLSSFPLQDVLTRLKDEFTYHANAKQIRFVVSPTSIAVTSDAGLLEQILRNLVSNALKFTTTGTVLVGCRRHGDVLSIEVWDTGVGIPLADQEGIFDAYRQLDNDARERNKGMGLGLSIVQRLGALLEHPVIVRSTPGMGSVFAVRVPIDRTQQDLQTLWKSQLPHGDAEQALSGVIVLIEDDPELRELLVQHLSAEGHVVSAFANGVDAIAHVRGQPSPVDLILADYNLPGGVDGAEAGRQINVVLANAAPMLILTGDISTRATHHIEACGAMHLNKPVKADALRDAVRGLLGPVHPARPNLPPLLNQRRTNIAAPAGASVIYLVDDDAELRDGLRQTLEASQRHVIDFESCEAFLNAEQAPNEACLILDASLPGMDGLTLLEHLRTSNRKLPTIMLTGHSDIAMAVTAMKAGAVDFLEKPVTGPDLLRCVDRALSLATDERLASEWSDHAVRQIETLTPRQLEIMDMVLAGHPNKNIAADLHISQRTVENHRAAIMHRTGAKSLPALTRLAVAARSTGRATSE